MSAAQFGVEFSEIVFTARLRPRRNYCHAASPALLLFPQFRYTCRVSLCTTAHLSVALFAPSRYLESTQGTEQKRANSLVRLNTLESRFRALSHYPEIGTSQIQLKQPACRSHRLLRTTSTARSQSQKKSSSACASSVRGWRNHLCGLPIVLAY